MATPKPPLPPPCAVVFVKNVPQLTRFYQAVAAMEVLEDQVDHAVLEGAGFQLVIHGLSKAWAAAISISTPPALREDTPIKLALPVASIDQARKQAAALGGRVKPKAAEWAARGFRACDGHDPEGNVFQVRESAA